MSDYQMSVLPVAEFPTASNGTTFIVTRWFAHLVATGCLVLFVTRSHL
jgi:hypothetical protein